ncbi:SagB family peptide dehydrogenase [Catellatospora coxensis]|uniref:NADH oxidase n=1 Tax=Catellatospora coxensis TaxID=310354 RepID=A0A8J3P654_9ACTN|nr:SagB family peptide dehydrogenase [Catellatospora coxensis]GIG05102.1 NADH oxidase [Catellatospora coxensis]
MTTTSDYIDAVLRRARAPMPPFGWETDWHDQPLRHKVYPQVHRLPLPAGLDQPAGPLGRALTVGPAGPADGFTLDRLAGLLRTSYGLLERRLRVTGNDDNDRRYWGQNTTWGRGTASGGGLYPLEIYWVSGPSGPVLPGVYHYSSPHHAMERLLAGDVTEQVRAAAPHAAEIAATDQFLLVTVKFWKNAFKYNSFCYHVVTMDLGALLGTWRLWNAAQGLPATPTLWFDDAKLNGLLGLDGFGESVLAVVPLPWARPAAPGTASAAALPGADPAVGRAEWERSLSVHRFTQVEAVHQATLLDASARPPAAGAAADAAARPVRVAAEPVSLPPPDFDRLDADVAAVLRRRRSSFGAFVGRPRLPAEDLSVLLASASAAARLPLDARGSGDPPFTRLCVFVNHVAGVPAGVYDYDDATATLHPVRAAALGELLQRNYFLDNYNLEQAAAVIAVVARPVQAVAALGDRGYRAVNAEVGAVTQGVYLAATGLGVGCGAALGFDNTSLAELADLADGDEWPLIILMVGNERSDDADVDYRLS